MQLNLGSGFNKIKEFINIDINPSCKPDLVCDFSKYCLPFKDNSVDLVVMYHTIEHIQKKNHSFILNEVNRVLCEGGTFVLSYPEWSKCVQNYTENKYGKKDFWEATLYGRQMHVHDFHVCIMDTAKFSILAGKYGFEVSNITSESYEDYNTILVLEKRSIPCSYEQILRDAVWPRETTLQQKSEKISMTME